MQTLQQAQEEINLLRRKLGIVLRAMDKMADNMGQIVETNKHINEARKELQQLSTNRKQS